MIAGRPVRFVVIVVGGWSMMRVVLLLPAPDGADKLLEPQVRPTVLSPAVRPAVPIPRIAQVQGIRSETAASSFPTTISFGRTGGKPDLITRSSAQPAFAEAQAATAPAPEPAYAPQESGIPGPPRHEGRSSRWSGAAWMLWRPDGGEASLAPAGRLGGSQAGLRIDYALDAGSALRPALYGRLSGALGRPVAAEAAIGLALRPTALPLVFGLERRAALSRGGRNAFAFIAAGGIYRRPLMRHLRVDGYGQVGIVGFTSPDAFADGRLTLESVLGRTGRHGSGDIAIGAAVWGGAQPGLARLDIGPQATARLPVGGTHVRLGTEWRQRIAGDVRPASGPAVTLGLDF